MLVLLAKINNLALILAIYILVFCVTNCTVLSQKKFLSKRVLLGGGLLLCFMTVLSQWHCDSVLV